MSIVFLTQQRWFLHLEMTRSISRENCYPERYPASYGRHSAHTQPQLSSIRLSLVFPHSEAADPLYCKTVLYTTAAGAARTAVRNQALKLNCLSFLHWVSLLTWACSDNGQRAEQLKQPQPDGREDVLSSVGCTHWELGFLPGRSFQPHALQA